MVVTGAALIAALLAGCFSERGEPTPPEAGVVCQIPENVDVDGSTVVFIRDFAFHPTVVHVRRGERVTWVNCETTPGLSHTSSADAGAWNSPLIAPATAFTASMNVVGTFSYHCDPHPFMTGTVAVD